MESAPHITSVSNPRIKRVVKLQRRSHRDELGLTVVEGYREVKRALDNAHPLVELLYCRDWFLGRNEDALLARAAAAGVELLACSREAFAKCAYRDRPEGLLAVARPIGRRLEAFDPGPDPLLVIAEAVEKPGNLGTIIRSADGAGAAGVIVCDRCTDLNNPNVIRASIGLCFSLPVVEADAETLLPWLRARRIRTVATTPHTDDIYTDVDLRRGCAVLVGTEQVGLTDRWLQAADVRVRIPMLGQADSLNVAAATTILLYEAARQRGFRAGGAASA